MAEAPALRQMNINAEADGVAEEAISAWKTVAACNAQYFFVQVKIEMAILLETKIYKVEPNESRFKVEASFKKLFLKD